jgi:hypothetical protein
VLDAEQGAARGFIYDRMQTVNHTRRARVAARATKKGQCISLQFHAVESFDNHAAMVAIHAVYYNFARIHKRLRITPAMAAGLSDHVWSLEEIMMMADNYMPKPAKRCPYRKKSAA